MWSVVYTLGCQPKEKKNWGGVARELDSSRYVFLEAQVCLRAHSLSTRVMKATMVVFALWAVDMWREDRGGQWPHI